ncbi:SAM-dependent methyltransferase [Agromyces terreus]|uniref:SAM-dependent methyltransferase n=1 Tax=Agromyces terreus TaxID=424795 RepID=A0A9X2KC28_9MICO|nr:class I SAM-dependent methyltransferase [Agromyces terreus]MCP2370795.1 SAM-dependent methyltransferase [Agromyces terreus]
MWNPISMATVLRAAPRFGELVLDACCGDGASAVPTAELVGPGGAVDAVDRSEAMTELARERAEGEAAPLPQLRLHAADATEWEPVGYDLVQCVLGVFFFDDVEGGVAHLVDRLKPGGRFVVTLWAPGAVKDFTEALCDAVEAEGGEAGAEAVAAYRSGGRPDVPSTPGALAQWLGSFGLERTRGELVPRHLDLDDDLAWRLVLGMSRRRLVADLDDATRDRVATAFHALRAERGISRVDLSTIIGVGHRPE